MAIAEHRLQLYSCQFFVPTLISVFIFWGKELLHWTYHTLLVVEVRYGSEQKIILGNKIWTICSLWYQFDSLIFLEFIPETSTMQILQNFFTHPGSINTRFAFLVFDFNFLYCSNLHKWVRVSLGASFGLVPHRSKELRKLLNFL